MLTLEILVLVIGVNRAINTVRSTKHPGDVIPETGNGTETVSASVVFARGKELKKVASSMCGISNDISCLLPGSQSAGGGRGGCAPLFSSCACLWSKPGWDGWRDSSGERAQDFWALAPQSSSPSCRLCLLEVHVFLRKFRPGRETPCRCYRCTDAGGKSALSTGVQQVSSLAAAWGPAGFLQRWAALKNIWATNVFACTYMQMLKWRSRP